MSSDLGLSSSQSDLKEWQDALCFLYNFSWPLKVRVHTGPSVPLDETTETRRIQLYPGDLKYILEEMKVVLGNASDELVVPEKCLIANVARVTKVSTPGNKKGHVKLFDHYYNQVILENLSKGDVVVWAQPPSTAHSRSNLQTCTLYFVGADAVNPCSVYAFVCPQKSISDVFLSSEQRKCGKIVGWGTVYRVPLTEIYRWEDINQTQRLISSQLEHVFLECHEKSNAKYRFELVYICKSAQKGSQLKDVKYPNLNEMKVGKLEEGKPLTQEKVSKESLEGTSDKTESEISGGLVRPNMSTKNSRTSCEDNPLQNPSSQYAETIDDRAQIRDGNVSNLTRQFCRQNSSGESSFLGKGMKTLRDESYKIILFGWCFATSGIANEMQEVNGIKLGDVVVASPNQLDQEDILGKVSKICEIPSLRSKQIFVGVKFEEKVNTSPFEVRHVWGEENGECFTRCLGGKKVFIPIEHFLSTSSYSQSILRVLREPNDVEASTMTSEIKVDFKYEASRKDFVTTPIYFDTNAKGQLKEMGIDGKANSCYIDSALFALYAFTCNFDGGLIKPKQNAKHSSKVENVKVEAARNLLKYDIVTQLRSFSKVNWVSVFKFRKVLSEILNDKSYLGNFMDAEAFITSLFADVLQVPEFFELGEDTKDYILQLFPPVTDTKTGKAKGESRASVQYILDEYFGWAGVKLKKIPQVGFLVKLPVSDGVPHFKYAYPNLKLDLGKVLEKIGKGERFMNLRAVICLKSSHFTCFARNTARSNDGKPIWLFHDSMAKGVGESVLTVCPHLETALEIASPVFDTPPGKNESLPEEATAWLDLLLKTAYICVYEPVTSHETQL